MWPLLNCNLDGSTQGIDEARLPLRALSRRAPVCAVAAASAASHVSGIAIPFPECHSCAIRSRFTTTSARHVMQLMDMPLEVKKGRKSKRLSAVRQLQAGPGVARRYTAVQLRAVQRSVQPDYY